MKKVVMISALIGLGIVGVQSCSDGLDDSKSQVSYQCPMKCEGDKTYLEKGNCSVCGMELTAKN